MKLDRFVDCTLYSVDSQRKNTLQIVFAICWKSYLINQKLTPSMNPNFVRFLFLIFGFFSFIK